MVSHEIGHLLGWDHDSASGSIMTDSLAAGTRLILGYLSEETNAFPAESSLWHNRFDSKKSGWILRFHLLDSDEDDDNITKFLN